MKNYYSKLSPERFKLLAICFMLFGDFVLFRFLWVRFIKNPKMHSYIDQSINLLVQNGQFDASALPPDFHAQILDLMTKSLLLIFALILFFHLANYAAYWKDKILSFYYLRLLVWFGAFGAFFVGITSFNLGLLAYLIILLSFMYLFVAIGFIYFPVKVQVIEND